MDIATLKLGADASDIVGAESALDDLSAAAKEASRETQTLKSDVDVLNDRYERLRAGAEQLTASQRQLNGTAAQLRAAKGQVKAATDAYTAAQKRERDATNAATRAAQAKAKALRQLNNRQGQLAFQLNDITQGLLTGQPPFQVAIQQGAQLAQIYGGPGGLATALKDTRSLLGGVITILAPLAAGIAVVAAATAGLTATINESSDVSVTMGDTLQAVAQLGAEAFTGLVNDVLAPFGQTFQDLWRGIQRGSALVFNNVTRRAAVFIEGMKSNFRIAAIAASSFISDPFGTLVGLIEASINRAINAINLLINEYNNLSKALGGVGGQIQALGSVRFNIELGEGAQKIREEIERSQAAIATINQTDFASQFVDAVGARAIQIRQAKDLEASEKDRLKRARELARLEEQRLRNLEREQNRLQSIAQSSFEARLEIEGRTIELIGVRLATELEAIARTRDEIIRLGGDEVAARTQAAEAIANAQIVAAQRVADEQARIADEVRQRELEQARLARDARGFDIGLREQALAANDNNPFGAIGDQVGIDIANIGLERDEQTARAQEIFERRREMVEGNQALIEQLEQEHQARLAQIQANALAQQNQVFRNAHEARLDIFQSIAGSLSTAIAAAAGRNSKIAEAAARVDQSIALGRAVVNTATGVTEALAGPFPANLVNAALVGAAGAAQIATIGSQLFGGGGGGSASVPNVPRGGASTGADTATRRVGEAAAGPTLATSNGQRVDGFSMPAPVVNIINNASGVTVRENVSESGEMSIVIERATQVVAGQMRTRSGAVGRQMRRQVGDGLDMR